TSKTSSTKLTATRSNCTWLTQVSVLAYLRYNPQSTFEREVESMGYEIIAEKEGFALMNAKFENGSCVLYQQQKYTVVRSVFARLPATGVESYVYRIESNEGNIFHIVPEKRLKICV
ncbi:MAG: hypothetical protein AAF348_18220, partial [Bacteroidota bacterium]